MDMRGYIRKLKEEGTYCMVALRRGLMMAVPVLLLGSFSLVFLSFPMSGYQQVLRGLLDGQVIKALEYIYGATLGWLTAYLILTVSTSYGRQMDQEHILFYPLVALSSYMGVIGSPAFTAEWIFAGLSITLISCILLNKILRALKGKTLKYITGSDYYFHLVMESLIPILIVISIFVIASRGVGMLLPESMSGRLKSLFFYDLFNWMGGNIFSAILYIIITHMLWFVGIHGTNMLEEVSADLFEQGIGINAELVASGQAPVEIFTKTFLDTFVFMGGAGTTLCFVIALMAVSKKASSKRLGKLSAIPVLFNINETIIFGYPLIFNQIMLVPFILTPIIIACISGLMIYLGLVPIAVRTVGWTVPVLFSGYYATGSFRGSLLQLFNIALGTAFYMPFIHMSEKKGEERLTKEIRHIERDLIESERMGREPDLLADHYTYNTAAKTLAMDLRLALSDRTLMMYYQPQMDSDERVHGAEALLRWKHPIAGFIMPPLIIRLAIAEGIMDELGRYIIEMVLADIGELEPILSDKVRVSINISPPQLDSPDFIDWVARQKEQAGLERVSLMFEFTEQVALSLDGPVRTSLKRLAEMDIAVSMDDFGMGHSSIMYLNESTFQEVKLDGELVRQILHNARSREIVKAITHLSKGLQFQVVAEFVETQEQKDMLRDLGCNIYQGYLYSPPVPITDLIKFIQKYDQSDGHKAG